MTLRDAAVQELRGLLVASALAFALIAYLTKQVVERPNPDSGGREVAIIEIAIVGALMLGGLAPQS